jgi:MYXO-CTERM domain-containing protein
MARAIVDVANQGIIAGQNTAAGSSAVPGLGGLAALAIGAAGVRSRRQRTVA